MPGIKPKETVTKVWSPELAYAVGLLATDGNLSPDGRHINLTSKDIDLLETFKRCLGLKNTIGEKHGGFEKRTTCFSVQFGDIVFYRWLLALGLTPNKSKTIGALKIPDRYFFDFLRGSFDGDGCILSYWDPRWASSHMFYIKFSSASPAHLRWLQETLIRLINISGRIKPAGACHQLSFAKKDSKILFVKMFYSDTVPHLKRKFVKAMEIFKVEDRHNNARVAESVDVYV